MNTLWKNEKRYLKEKSGYLDSNKIRNLYSSFDYYYYYYCNSLIINKYFTYQSMCLNSIEAASLIIIIFISLIRITALFIHIKYEN
jgi:hypothetical protein